MYITCSDPLDLSDLSMKLFRDKRAASARSARARWRSAKLAKRVLGPCFGAELSALPALQVSMSS